MQYDSRQNSHQAKLPAWDATCVCYDGCSAVNWGPFNEAVLTDPGDGVSYNYTPYYKTQDAVPFYKLYPDGHGKERVRALHGGKVVMTPHSRSSVETEDFLVHMPNCNGGMRRYCSRPQRRKVGGVCTMSCYDKELQQDYNTWDDVYAYSEWVTGAQTIRSNRIPLAGISDALAEVRNEAASKSYRDYDALTDIMQLGQNARMFKGAAHSIDKGFRKFINGFPSSDIRKASTMLPGALARNASRAMRQIGNAWLAYRYGWMPIIYSLKDISKACQLTTTCRDRARRTLSSESLNPSLPTSGDYTLRTESGSISISAVVITKYTTNSVARAQKVGFNPLSTAWEMIPFSFVIDWFVNVGDYITAATTPDFSSSAGACTVVKKELVVEFTAVRIRNSNIYTTEIDNTKHQVLCWSSYPSVPAYHLGTVQEVIRRQTYRTYSRQLFARSASLRPPVGSNINWKRWADSIALSNQLFRSLKNLF